jgi:hypothetical protein
MHPNPNEFILKKFGNLGIIFTAQKKIVPPTTLSQTQAPWVARRIQPVQGFLVAISKKQQGVSFLPPCSKAQTIMA